MAYLSLQLEEEGRKYSGSVDIDFDKLWAFALLLKRLQYDHIRECAQDAEEAEEIRSGLFKVQELLAQVKIQPR